MKTHINAANDNQVDAGYETSKFALGVGITMAVLVGLWGTACLVNALVGTGFLNLIKNYFTAILG